MYITLTKKKIFILLCFVIAVFLLVGWFLSAGVYNTDVSTNAKRVEYINSLGIKLLNDDYSKKETIIPHIFNDVYTKYNALQKRAGFDLTNYSGEDVIVYTYMSDGGTAVNLIVCKGRLIGGDICDLSIDGQMLPLRKG